MKLGRGWVAATLQIDEAVTVVTVADEATLRVATRRTQGSLKLTARPGLQGVGPPAACLPGGNQGAPGWSSGYPRGNHGAQGANE